MSLRARFDQFAKSASAFSGRPSGFVLAFGAIIVWAMLGPVFHFSDTWQLVINTGTTIVTFLMVFLIQNTQNRDIGATQLKLDELIRATHGAKNALLDLEEMDEATLEQIRKEYEGMAEKARQHVTLQRQKRAAAPAAPPSDQRPPR